MDLTVFNQIHHGWRSASADFIFTVLSYLGLGQVGFVAALLCWFHRPARPFVLPVCLTILLTGTLLAQSVKALVPRDRPSSLATSRPLEPHRKSSFPSGHTTTAFAIATTVLLVARRRKQADAIGVGLFPLAFGVGLSRIYRGVHWPSDVLAGACLGVFGACLLEIALRGFDPGSPPE